MNKNKINTLLILSFLCLFAFQGSTQIVDLGMETQLYPTGIIPGVRIEYGFAEKNAVHLRLGVNIIRHQDLGVHEDERGSGYGFSLGYKRYLKPAFKGFFFGIKNDIWFNTLDWKDQIGDPLEQKGQSKVTVVQPTAEVGYLFHWSSNWFLAPNLAFGYEVNVKTEGEPIGEGAILLIGFTAGRRF